MKCIYKEDPLRALKKASSGILIPGRPARAFSGQPFSLCQEACKRLCVAI
jgi:hypothetical protein